MVTEAEVPCYLCGEEVVIGDALDIDKNNKVATSTNITFAKESGVAKEAGNKSRNRKSFFVLFDAKIKQIMDLAEGSIEPVSVKDDTVEQYDEKQIWEMFENVKTKVMNMDISEAIGSTKSREEGQISNNDSTSVNSSTIQKEGETKWYQGTFYESYLCQNCFYGQETFKNHLTESIMLS